MNVLKSRPRLAVLIASAVVMSVVGWGMEMGRVDAGPAAQSNKKKGRQVAVFRETAPFLVVIERDNNRPFKEARNIRCVYTDMSGTQYDWPSSGWLPLPQSGRRKLMLQFDVNLTDPLDEADQTPAQEAPGAKGPTDEKGPRQRELIIASGTVMITLEDENDTIESEVPVQESPLDPCELTVTPN